MMHYSAV